MRKTRGARRLAAQDRSRLHSLSVPAFEGLGQALEALRRRRGWSAAEAARRTGIDQSNLSKYERNAKGITTATLDRILTAYETTLAELAAILREVQGGPSMRWIVPGEVSVADLKLVVRKVLGKDWVPPEEDEEEEEETSPGEELPNGGEDDDG
jgi:transcriptional regulator with XRE-family HTH domain